MRFILFLVFVFSSSMAWCDVYGTYEDTDRKMKRLKDLNGKDYPYQGQIRPGMDLRGVDLSNANLFRANLRGVDLTTANLSGAYLRESILDGAILDEANFEGANLDFAKISRIGLTNRGSTRTNFQKASISGTVFRHLAGWGKADWRGARYQEGRPPLCPPDVSLKDHGIRSYSGEEKDQG